MTDKRFCGICATSGHSTIECPRFDATLTDLERDVLYGRPDKPGLPQGIMRVSKAIKRENKSNKTNVSAAIVKRRAQHNARYAISTGRLVKQPCENCQSLEVEAHHDDYLKALDIRWFCKRHHAARHKELAWPTKRGGSRPGAGRPKG